MNRITNLEAMIDNRESTQNDLQQNPRFKQYPVDDNHEKLENMTTISEYQMKKQQDHEIEKQYIGTERDVRIYERTDIQDNDNISPSANTYVNQGSKIANTNLINNSKDHHFRISSQNHWPPDTVRTKVQLQDQMI